MNIYAAFLNPITYVSSDVFHSEEEFNSRVVHEKSHWSEVVFTDEINGRKIFLTRDGWIGIEATTGDAQHSDKWSEEACELLNSSIPLYIAVSSFVSPMPAAPMDLFRSKIQDGKILIRGRQLDFNHIPKEDRHRVREFSTAAAYQEQQQNLLGASEYSGPFGFNFKSYVVLSALEGAKNEIDQLRAKAPTLSLPLLLKFRSFACDMDWAAAFVNGILFIEQGVSHLLERHSFPTKAIEDATLGGKINLLERKISTKEERLLVFYLGEVNKIRKSLLHFGKLPDRTATHTTARTIEYLIYHIAKVDFRIEGTLVRNPPDAPTVS